MFIHIEIYRLLYVLTEKGNSNILFIRKTWGRRCQHFPIMIRKLPLRFLYRNHRVTMLGFSEKLKIYREKGLT